MSTRHLIRFMLALVLLASASLACQLVNKVQDGIKMIGTAQEVATDIGEFATQFIPGGIEETTMAFVTEVDESGILETAQAAITENAPAVGETMQAVATEVYTSPEEAPGDIPIMEGEISAFIGSPKSVSYFINAELQDVVDFYKREMTAEGWQELSTNEISSDNIVEIEYQKEGRSATVVLTQIPFVGQTTVVISIEGS